MAKAPQADRLPIKLILPKQGAERRVSGGGGPPTPFRAVNEAYRDGLNTQLEAIRTAVFTRTAPAEVDHKLPALTTN
jgi:hypothetical protein